MKKKLLLLAVLYSLPTAAFAITQAQADQIIAQKNQDISASAAAQLATAGTISTPQGNAQISAEISKLQAEIPALRQQNEQYLQSEESAGQITAAQAQPYAAWTQEQAHSVPQSNAAIQQTLQSQQQAQQSIQAQYPIPSATTTLGALRADAAMIAGMAQTWQTLTSDATNYQNLMGYANAEWAGEGPQVSVAYGGVVQCHNPRWDAITQGFELPGLNLAGDGEVENYAIQAISTHFQMELADYMDVLMHSGQHPNLLHELEEQNGAMLASEKTLTGLLSTLSNQIQAAIGPNTTLTQLPVHYTVGVGDVAAVPGPAQSGYVSGPNDGAPIGFAVYPDLAYQVSSQQTVNGQTETVWTTDYYQMPNVDVCPTGSGGVSLSSTPILQAAQQAIADEPDLQGSLSALINTPSSYAATPYVSQSMSSLRPFGTSTRFVQVLGWDLWKIGGYMAPVTGSLTQFNQQVQQVMQEVNAG